MNLSSDKKTILIFTSILFLTIFLFTFRLGERSFRNPDEGRYAEIAREMALTNDWVVPKLYGVAYLRKPILFYWFLAGSFKLFGFNELAARIVPAFFGILGVIATFLFARKVFSRETAIYSSLILATNIWYLEIGRYLLIDMVFSFFVVLTLYLFYLGMTEVKRKGFYYLFSYLSLGLAFLAKGVAALIIIGFSIGLYLLLVKKVKQVLMESALPIGIFIFLSLVLPWFTAISMRIPDFLTSFFIYEHVTRFTSTNYEHQSPWYFYIALLPIMILPWSWFVQLLKKLLPSFPAPQKHEPKLYLFISSIIVILFFSLSRTKLLTYILPSIILLSLLLGEGWRKIVETNAIDSQSFKATRRLFFVLLGLSCLALVGIPVYFSYFNKQVPVEMLIPLEWIAVLMTGGVIASLYFMKRRDANKLFVSLLLMMALISIPICYSMEGINKYVTTKHFANELKPKLRPGDQVFIFDSPSSFYDFGFYLDYPVKLIGLQGETQLRTHDPEAQKATVTRDKFLNEIINSGQKIYCMIRKSDYLELDPKYRERFSILKEDKRKVLLESLP